MQELIKIDVHDGSTKETLKQLRIAGEFYGEMGKRYEITGGIEVEEIEFLSAITSRPNLNVLDIGVGKGVSTVLFASLGNVDMVVGVDPYQSTEHQNSMTELCRILKIPLSKVVVVEKKSIEAKPSLDSIGKKYDFVLIDGYHSFDSTLVDFLVGHEFLNDGGFVAFHDCFYRQKQKVLNFVLKNRDYELVKLHPKCRRPLLLRSARFIWHCLKYKTSPIIAIKYLNPLKTDSSLVVFKKISGKEPFYWEFCGL